VTKRGLALSLWVLVVAAALLTLPGAGARLDTDLLALFPDVERDPTVGRAMQRVAASGQDRIVLVVRVPLGPGAAARLAAASTRLDAQIGASDGLLEPESGGSGWSGRELFDWRFFLLTPDRLEALIAEPDATIAAALAATLAPGGMRAGSLASDPLGLHGAYLAGLLPPGVDPGSRSFTRDGHLNALHPVRTGATGFDLGRDERLQQWLADARDAVHALGGELLATGLPVFAADGAARARNEIATFGTLSLTVIVLLLVATFASVRPLVMTLIVAATGITVAFAATAAIFGRVHVLTLVFGSSLIGISIDEALHFLCEAWRDPAASPARALDRVLPGITVAMVTSAGAFLAFLVTPFPGLRQIAVFAATGLAAAWLTVVALAPWFPAPQT
jgi:predicted exporter